MQLFVHPVTWIFCCYKENRAINYHSTIKVVIEVIRSSISIVLIHRRSSNFVPIACPCAASAESGRFCSFSGDDISC